MRKLRISFLGGYQIFKLIFRFFPRQAFSRNDPFSTIRVRIRYFQVRCTRPRGFLYLSIYSFEFFEAHQAGEQLELRFTLEKKITTDDIVHVFSAELGPPC